MLQRLRQISGRRRRGFSLIDTVMSLVVISILILVFANLLTVRSVNRRTLFRTQAAAIANEELSALKRFDIGSLPNQTNGPFLGTLYNAGAWTIITDPSISHSATNSVDLAGITGFSNKISGRFQFPAGSYGDATLQVAINLQSDTAAGTAAGIFFRASDANNGYRLLVAPTGTDLDSNVVGQQNWVVEKIVSGTAVTPRIYSSNVAGISTNTWYTIKVIMVSTSIKTYLDGNGVDAGNLTDSSFTDGAAALIGWQGVYARFDDASTTVGLTTSSWNFDGSTTFPAAWIRLGLNDLPDSTSTTFDDNGTLTLAAYPNVNSTNLKQATIVVSWRGDSGSLTYTTTALLGSSQIGQ